MYPILQNKQLWDLTLLQILNISDNINSYALALGRSRNQCMTIQLATQLGRAVRRDERWLQVAKRVIEKDYVTAFQLCIHDDSLLQPLIAVYFTHPKSSPYYQNHSMLLYKKALTILEVPTNQLCNHMTKIKNFQLYLELTLKHEDTNIMRQLFNIFSCYPYQINNLISSISSVDTLSKNTNTNTEEGWTIHDLSVKIFRDIVGIIGFIENLAVRKMRVQQFDEKLTQRNKGYSIKQVIGQKIMSIAQLLGTRTNVSQSNNSYVNPAILNLLQSRKMVQLMDYYTDLCYIIMTTVKISAFEIMLIRNQPFLHLMTDIAKCADIFKLNNHSNYMDQVLAINDEISSHIYSDTLAGIFMRMITTLCINIGPFLNLYLQMLQKVFSSQQMNQVGNEQFIDYLLKVILLSDDSLVYARRQQIGNLLDLVNRVVAPNWSLYGEWQQLQILRYFMAFTGSFSRETGMSESAEDLILKCVVLCFSCLKSSNQNDHYGDHELTPIQLQCQNILQLLPEQPKMLNLIKKYLLPTILNEFIQFTNPSLAILQLFHSYITKVPDIVTRSSEYIIDYLYCLFMIQASILQKNSMQGFRIKSTQRILKILRILSTILENQSQLRDEDIQNKIIKPIVMKLCEPNSIEYEQDLLNLLELLLQKHCHLSPEICYIISKLPLIYENNNKKLSVLGNIYKAIALPKHIRDEVLYSYPDIVNIMLGMFVDYVQNALSVEQFLYYRDEVRALLWNFQLFLNKFGDLIIEDKMLMDMVGVNLFEGLGVCMDKTIRYIDQYNKSHQNHVASNSKIYYQFQQLQTQLFFTINRLSISPSAHPLNQRISSSTVKLIKALSSSNFIYFQTVRMIPVILIDQLFIEPDSHQNAASELVEFCQLMCNREMQWGINKEWGKVQGVEEWDLWPVKVKEYVENVLREMRNRKVIDQVDHAQYIQAISQVLR